MRVALATPRSYSEPGYLTASAMVGGATWVGATLVAVGDPEPHISNRDQDRRARLNQRLRHAFIDGAEMDSRRRLGRGLTDEELERVLRRYPGDVGADMTRGFRF